MVMQTVVFFGIASAVCAVELVNKRTEKSLVQCSQPVDVKFIATPHLAKPEFNEAVSAGQKQWWAYGCSMDIDLFATEEEHSSAEQEAIDRMLQSNNTPPGPGPSPPPGPGPGPSPSPKKNASNASNKTKAAGSKKTSTTGAAAKKATTGAAAKKATTGKTQESEVSKGSKPGMLSGIGAGLLSLFTLPFVNAASLSIVKDAVEVLMPCGALTSKLQDFDGDGERDCTMTQEQHKIVEGIKELEGTWRAIPRHSVNTDLKNLTIGDGAMCVDPREGVTVDMNSLSQEDIDHLPTAITNVKAFNDKGEECKASSAATCEHTMWSFDMSYPTSQCTPGVKGWIRPCTAKMMPDGALILARGQPVPEGKKGTERPPMMVSVTKAEDALPFANGYAAASFSTVGSNKLEVLVLRKAHLAKKDKFGKLFDAGDEDGSDSLSYEEFQTVMRKLPEVCKASL